jgi:hypothetical protein
VSLEEVIRHLTLSLESAEEIRTALGTWIFGRGSLPALMVGGGTPRSPGAAWMLGDGEPPIAVLVTCAPTGGRLVADGHAGLGFRAVGERSGEGEARMLAQAEAEVGRQHPGEAVARSRVTTWEGFRAVTRPGLERADQIFAVARTEALSDPSVLGVERVINRRVDKEGASAGVLELTAERQRLLNSLGRQSRARLLRVPARVFRI